jgi:hypothetical protein
MVVMAVAFFPRHFTFYPLRRGGRFNFFGVMFFAGIGRLGLGTYSYASAVRTLPAIEAAALVGAVLCAFVIALERRAGGNTVVAILAFPLYLGYGYTTLKEIDCALDHSSAKTYRTVVSSKSSFKGSLSVTLEPWGTEQSPRRVTASVPRETYRFLREGGPACVLQRSGAIGIGWFTVGPCP